MITRDSKVQITGKLSYRAEVLKAWNEPGATIATVYRKTGAPKGTVIKIRGELVAAGVLKAGGAKW